MAGGYAFRGGYLRLSNGGNHPLVAGRKDRHLDLHRALLHDRIGAGAHACHWCGWALVWETRPMDKLSREERDARLVVDHVDGRKLNLEPDNLVASCWWCNRVRHLADAQGVGDLHRFAAVAPIARPKLWGDAPVRDEDDTAEAPEPAPVAAPVAAAEMRPIKPVASIMAGAKPRTAAPKRRGLFR